MVPNAKICLYPADPDEAIRVLAEHGPRALILAGGTSAALGEHHEVNTLVDLTRMGFDSIEADGDSWSVGCNVRLQQLAGHAGLRGVANGLLTDAAAAVGSRPIRNAVTVGGNLIQVFRWSDTPVAWLALGAEAVLRGPDGERRLSVDDLLAQSPKKALRPGEILLSLQVPDRSAWVGAFIKYARTAVDYSVVDVAACVRGTAQRCSEARLVVGGARGRPFRCGAAENILTGGNLTRGRIDQAAVAAREETRAIPDTRTSRAYREQMVEVITRRTLQQIATRLKEQG